MEFLNKKEDVIEIQLTQYGKHLLSLGKFKPDHYAFFDDDIIYDSAYGGYEEAQNESDGRITTGSVSLAAQTVFTGLESEYQKSYKDMLSDVLTPGEVESMPLWAQEDPYTYANYSLASTGPAPFPKMQPVVEKIYSLKQPIGTSELNNSYAPSWQVLSYKTPIIGALPYMIGNDDLSMPTMQIPQIDFTVEFKSTVTFDQDLLDPEKAEDVMQAGLHPVNDALPSIYYEDPNIKSFPFGDGTVLHIKEDYIFLEINEKNSKFQNENYDIEVFMVEEDEYAGLNSKKQKLIPLLFRNDSLGFMDGQPISYFKSADITDSYIGNEEKFVEHYLDILVDSEISSDLYCEVKTTYKKDFLFEEMNINCDELEDEDSISAYNLSEDDSGEICN